MEYKDLLETRIKDYRTRKDNHDFIEPAEPFLLLDWTQDNRSYFRQLVEAGIVSKKAVEEATSKERKRERLARALGEAPATPRDFARLYAAKYGVTITYKGAITIPGRSSANILDFARSARLLAGELDVGFGRDSINDAVEDFYADTRDNALEVIKAKLEVRKSFDWIDMAETCFDCRNVGAPFVAAVIKSFFWQVRRKLHGMPVPSPLMPVIQGLQEKGKSYFVKRVVESVEELVSYSDFSAITDERNIDLWRSFIIVMDEMARAGKADVDATKTVITAEYLERRPMRTNSSVTVRQNATLIGTTNPSLAEIIRDETGNRRFVEIKWNPDYVQGGVDRFNFANAWGAIHQSDADPMSEYRDLLKAVQAESRNHGPVESWLMDIDASDWRNLFEKSEDGVIDLQSLFDAYTAHRTTVNGGTEPVAERRTKNAFSHELNRITSTTDYGIVKHRTSKANCWKLTEYNPAGLTLRVGGRAR